MNFQWINYYFSTNHYFCIIMIIFQVFFRIFDHPTANIVYNTSSGVHEVCGLRQQHWSETWSRLPRADCAEVAGARYRRTARWRRATKTCVVAGCDVDRWERAVVCTCTADERGPRTRRCAASLGSDDTRYDDVDWAPARSASLTTVSITDHVFISITNVVYTPAVI